MAGLNLNEHLHRTSPVDRLAAMTHAGQAHFAGTGPAHTTCRECVFFSWVGTGGWTSVNGKHAGAPKPACCAKFRDLTGGQGGKVPHDAAACKYFQREPHPQALRSPK